MNYNNINSSYEFRIFLHRNMSDNVLNYALVKELEKFYEVSPNSSDSYILKPIEDKYSDITDHYPNIDFCMYEFISSTNVISYISYIIDKESDKAYAYRIRKAFEDIQRKEISCSGLYQLLNIDKDTLILSF